MPFHWNKATTTPLEQCKAIYHELLSSHAHTHTHTHAHTHTQEVRFTAIQTENDFTVHGFYNICHDNCHQPTQSTIYSFQTSKRPLTVKHNICNHKKQFLASRSSTAHLSFYLSQQQSTTSKHAWAGGMRGAIESAAPGRGWRAQNVN